MAKRKNAFSEEKLDIISALLQEYDIKSAEDITRCSQISTWWNYTKYDGS
ncbi:MAG: hypothetical protein N4A50_13095 [Vallitalea sp.]|jgi:hypothetical protein|nr:hypothetical protein [Vallitalea sp.]